jgi:hypothetical protein
VKSARAGEGGTNGAEGILREAKQRWRPYMGDEETRQKMEELLVHKVMLAEFYLVSLRCPPAVRSSKRGRGR